ncbi:AAA family ATPase [Urechidicola croceus]|uniref:ATPase n=1 Tax=Urechidicola croceus TaxID=1850246 RepID=A0A1D8P4R4_9FLAO|nr:ATP-binding protein [Urechidicola croceus]AOW19554.1 ATPase [Urechidicola croceus]
MQQKIVITGGPGTGKTMVINDLIKRDYKCMLEVSRDVTLKAREKGIEQLFLTQPLLFSQLLLEGRIEQYVEASKLDHKLVFFDRGIPDVHSYMEFFGTEYPNTFIESCNNHRYNSIFLMPPWEKIYTSDNERYETFEQSLEIYHHLKDGYSQLNYDIIEVPFGTVEHRTEFILDLVK